MSFPNIPDINPVIDITLEDSINLLLISVALEEMSISKLLDAETCKILCVLDDCCHKDSKLHDALDINKSVDNTIKDLIKFQMLLQFKLENITELIPATTTTTTTSTTSTTTTTKSTSTTTTCTTTSTTSTHSTTTKKRCQCIKCSVMGKGKGCILNKSDAFYCQTALLKAFVFSCDFKNRSLRYEVQNDVETLCMVAKANCITIECPSPCGLNRVIICGKGNIEIKSKCNRNITGTVSFEVEILDEKVGKSGFKMVIITKDKKDLIHDSGFVLMKSCDSDLRIQTCY